MVVRIWKVLLTVAVIASSVHGRKYFYQNVCSDSSCRDNCQESELPQNECLITTGGGSAVCHCTESAFEQDVYVFTDNCTLYYYPQTAELGVCLNGQSGYVEYACPSSYSRRRNHRAKDGELNDSVDMATSHIPMVTPLEGLIQFGLTSTKAPASARRTSSLIGLKQLSRNQMSVLVSGNSMRVKIDGVTSEKDLIRAGVIAHSLRNGGVSVHILRSDLPNAKSLTNVVEAQQLIRDMSISYDELSSSLVLDLPLDRLMALRIAQKSSACHIVIVHDVAHEELITLAL
ncbi:cysteine peptidase, putative [Bodo saltans]|uniref:Cysteine peptidase, putative n=1 Tax=Bodo saltans TaxID=75058 RepID=A0A0S4KNQ2_BODSA|nr:cysteine peptidase, putative [Bodo saltans]|eukprot:CUM57963.1 cysteine peptidase, putative [Bodo saltans]